MSLLIEALRRAEQAKKQQNQPVKEQASPQSLAGETPETVASPSSGMPTPPPPEQSVEDDGIQEEWAAEPVELDFDRASELSKGGEEMEDGEAPSEDKGDHDDWSGWAGESLSLLEEGEASPPSSDDAPPVSEGEAHWREGELFELLDEPIESSPPSPPAPEVAESRDTDGGERPRPAIHHEELLEFLDEEAEPEAPQATEFPPAAAELTPSRVPDSEPRPESAPRQDDLPPPIQAAPTAVNPISGDGRLKPKVPISQSEIQDEAEATPPDEKPLQGGEDEKTTQDRETETAREILRASSRASPRQRKSGLPYGLLLIVLLLLLAAGGFYYYLEVYQSGFPDSAPVTRPIAASLPTRAPARGESVPSSDTGQNRQSLPPIGENPAPEPARTAEPPPEQSLPGAPELNPPETEPQPETAQIKQVMPPAEPRAEKSELELESPPLTPIPATGLEIQRQEPSSDLPRQLARAYAAYQQGDWEQARNFYAASLAEDARNRDALLGLAALAARRGDTRAARAYYRQVERLYPEDPVAAMELATLDTDQSPEQQENRLKTLIADQPDSAPLHFALGNLYRRQSRWRDAQQAYFEAYRHHDTHPDYAYNLAVSLDHLGKTEPALSFYHRAMQLASTRAASFDRAAVVRRIQVLNASDTP